AVRWRSRMLARMDAVFVHADALAAQVEAAARRKAVVIPHGDEGLFLDVAGPDPGWRRRWALPPKAPVGLLFGTLTAYKGIPTLLTALAEIPPTQRPWMVIAGFPAANAHPQAWRRQAGQLGLGPWLRWELDYVPAPQVPWLLRAVDFLVLPYWEASQSGVAHLALTFATPVIATTVGGLPAAVRHEITGLLVPPRDAAALAAAILRLATAPELRRRLAANAAAAQREHAWDAIARRLLAVLFPGISLEAAHGQGAARAGHAEQQNLAGDDDVQTTQTGGADQRQNDHRAPGRRRVLKEIDVGDCDPGDAQRQPQQAP
ncbi:MAG: glycosyltransferase, partial [Terriglobales bacterium]